MSKKSMSEGITVKNKQAVKRLEMVLKPKFTKKIEKTLSPKQFVYAEELYDKFIKEIVMQCDVHRVKPNEDFIGALAHNLALIAAWLLDD